MTGTSARRLIVIGGGAAGFFAAIHAKTNNPALSVLILESAKKVLGKVKISGGGRCNVTHHCFDAGQLVKHYPRGERELRGVFSRFGPEDTIRWFEDRGVTLKTESDNRVFPTTDDSQTIIDCLSRAANDLGIRVFTEHPVSNLVKTETGFKIETPKNIFDCETVLLAPGASKAAWRWCESLGHTVVPPVPSLFTFKITDSRLSDLAGISFKAVQGSLCHPERSEGSHPKRITQTGDLLITHWGLSGPLVLRLSAWGARPLFECSYNAQLVLDFFPQQSQNDLVEKLARAKTTQGDKLTLNDNPFELPRRFWERLLTLENLSPETRWRDTPNKAFNKIAEQLKHGVFQIHGKGEFKDEFVTAGGVSLKEVDFKTMQSKLIPNLYFSGEIIDVDGLTGGFNFQNAWSTGFIAGASIASL